MTTNYRFIQSGGHMDDISTPRTGQNSHPAPNWISAESTSAVNRRAAEIEANLTEFWRSRRV